MKDLGADCLCLPHTTEGKQCKDHTGIEEQLHLQQRCRPGVQGWEELRRRILVCSEEQEVLREGTLVTVLCCSTFHDSDELSRHGQCQEWQGASIKWVHQCGKTAWGRDTSGDRERGHWYITLKTLLRTVVNTYHTVLKYNPQRCHYSKQHSLSQCSSSPHIGCCALGRVPYKFRQQSLPHRVTSTLLLLSLPSLSFTSCPRPSTAYLPFSVPLHSVSCSAVYRVHGTK